MHVHPNNTASQFTTKLSEPIELEGSWEVGLIEVMILSKVVNVFGDRFHYELRTKDNRCIKCVLNPGVYSSITMLIVEIRCAYLRAVNDKETSGRAADRVQLFMLRVTYTYESEDVIAMKFSDKLAIMLGFEPNKEYA